MSTNCDEEGITMNSGCKEVVLVPLKGNDGV